jgi:SsrA-binding protein
MGHEYAVNRRASFDYEIIETFEAGIALRGFEVKAIKSGRVNLAGSFVIVRNNEAWLINASIPPYQSANTPVNYDPTQSRKLLLHKSQIKELLGGTSRVGLTLVPLKMYNKNKLIKLLIGLARSKKKSDKREIIKKREVKKEIARAIKRG